MQRISNACACLHSAQLNTHTYSHEYSTAVAAASTAGNLEVVPCAIIIDGLAWLDGWLLPAACRAMPTGPMRTNLYNNVALAGDTQKGMTMHTPQTYFFPCRSAPYAWRTGIKAYHAERSFRVCCCACAGGPGVRQPVPTIGACRAAVFSARLA